MKFQAKQILSVLLTMSLVWIFVGCAFSCGEISDCVEDSVSEFSPETSVKINDSSSDESCPINESVKMTAPERNIPDFNSAAVITKISDFFSAVPVSLKFLKYQAKFYRPPNIDLHQKRLTILRI